MFESQWKQWTNLTAPASDASFKETSEYLFKKQCHAYMSVREGLWTDFQTLIGDKKAAQRELSNDLQFDMDEELYSMLVEEFVKSPAFVDWYKMHSYHEPMGPLDEIIPAVVAGDKEVGRVACLSSPLSPLTHTFPCAGLGPRRQGRHRGG